MKLCNLASLDPVLKLHGIKGLSGASKLDEIVWTEFHAYLDEAVHTSEEAHRSLVKASEDAEVQIQSKKGICLVEAPPTGSTDVIMNVKA